MNIYVVDAGEQREAVYEDRSVNAGHWEYWYALAIVRAKSRGQARAIAAAKFGLEYLDKMSVRLLLPDVSGAPGDMTEAHPAVWWLYHKICFPDSTIHQFIGDY